MTTEYSTGYEPRPEAFSVAQQLTHLKMAGEEIFALEQDGRNWSAYRKMLLHEADVEGLRGLFDGTEAQPLDERGTDSLWDQWNAQAMCLFTMTIPDSLFLRISHFDTVREVLLYLQSLFEKTTTTTTTVHDNDTTRTAARARKAFGGTCRKCGEVGHKARECARVENRPEKSNVEEVDEVGVAEADENAETTGIEEVEVEFDEIVEMAGEEGDAEMAEEAHGQGADGQRVWATKPQTTELPARVLPHGIAKTKVATSMSTTLVMNLLLHLFDNAYGSLVIGCQQLTDTRLASPAPLT